MTALPLFYFTGVLLCIYIFSVKRVWDKRFITWQIFICLGSLVSLMFILAYKETKD